MLFPLPNINTYYKALLIILCACIFKKEKTNGAEKITHNKPLVYGILIYNRYGERSN